VIERGIAISMSKLKFKIIINVLYTNRWAIFICIIIPALAVILILPNIEKRVSADCTIFDKGVAFSKTGNVPNFRCRLENGHIEVVSGKSSHYEIGDVITIQTRQSNLD